MLQSGARDGLAVELNPAERSAAVAIVGRRNVEHLAARKLDLNAGKERATKRPQAVPWGQRVQAQGGQQVPAGYLAIVL